LDFENIKNFCVKYFSRELNAPVNIKQSIFAILRRMSDNPDGKITFREFSQAITPILAGLRESATHIEFNKEEKQRVEKEFRDSPTRSKKSVRAPFRQI
jgi:hypothetical protein